MKQMTTAYKILVCRHREQRFLGILSEYIENEADSFNCGCNTNVNHKNLVTCCNECLVPDFQADNPTDF